MLVHKFSALLGPMGWISPAFVTVDHAGLILGISQDIPSGWEGPVSEWNTSAIPSIPNCHSHVFQHAMAGLAEGTSERFETDDFWSWRTQMYDLAQKVGPDDLESIATFVYGRMAALGYGAVAEFHYVHHDQNGSQYSDPAELSKRLVAAAARAGIDITIIPIYYRTSGFGVEPLPEQRRFVSRGPGDYYRLVESLAQFLSTFTHARLGVGVHSLRAAPVDEVADIFERMYPDLPAHIHLAEQNAEVSACLAAHGRRPVELFFETVSVTERYSLVHCTQVKDHETRLLAGSGANIVLCPTTEGNLGDGFFPLSDFLKYCGKFSIGSDSQISLCPRRELQFLDYGQRLVSQRRNVICKSADQECGDILFWNAVLTGQQSLGFPKQKVLEVGSPLNVQLVKCEVSPRPMAKNLKFISQFLYADGFYQLWGTMHRGRLVAQEGRHIDERQHVSAYHDALRRMT
jgi:formimidoylglutamate deiminase